MIVAVVQTSMKKPTFLRTKRILRTFSYENKLVDFTSYLPTPFRVHNYLICSPVFLISLLYFFHGIALGVVLFFPSFLLSGVKVLSACEE